MANHKATGKKAKHGVEMAQRVRAAVLGAFDAVEKRGKLISEILADELEQNPVKFIELASKLIPRESKVEHSGSVHQTVEHRAVAEIDRTLSAWLADTEVERPEKTVSH